MPRGKYPRKIRRVIVSKDDVVEMTPAPCGAFISNDPTLVCALESDHDGDHEWVKDRHCETEPKGHAHHALVIPTDFSEGVQVGGPIEPAPARACARCVAFEQDEPAYGWCRLYPQAVRQSVTSWCMQWKAKL